MILFPPSALYGDIGAVLSALIIVLCCIGLTIHKDVYAHRIRRDFYHYYTNLSNLLVLVYFSLIAPFLYASSTLRRLIPTAEYCVTMAIMLTHAVFHFVIFPGILRLAPMLIPCRETIILAADNLIIHYAVPWLTFIYWLLCSPGKHTIPLYAALLWTAFPLAYAAAVFLRGRTGRFLYETQSPYPYPFLDVNLLGMRCVLRNCIALYAACALLSGGLLLLIRLLNALWGTQILLLPPL